jgi:hypothetical protein
VGAMLVMLLLFVFLYRNVIVKNRFKNSVGHLLYRYSNLNDYLLLNNYHIYIDDKNIGEIDHVLITNKFIVVINDAQLSGVISGDYSSDNLKFTTKNGNELILNPLNYNRNLTKRVALFNDLDNSYLKGIVVVPDDSYINIDNIPEQFFICKKRDLKKTIKEIEREEVKPFKEDTIVNFINYLNNHNVVEEKK